MNIGYTDNISATNKLKVAAFIVELNKTIENFVYSNNYELICITSEGCNIITTANKNYFIKYRLNYETQGLTIIVEERKSKSIMFIDVTLDELDKDNIKNNIIFYIDAEIK